MTAWHVEPVQLEVRGLRKRYGRLEALCGIDVAFAPGRVTAIVGPNAAGKSTLLKCVLGLVRPDAGAVLLDGVPVAGRSDYRSTIGYMPQRAAFPENLTGAEVLDLLRRVRRDLTREDEELLHRFQLQAELSKPVRALSGGTRQKLNAVVAFRSFPQVVVLDEPTAGLDPVASGVLKEKVLGHREAGATVILTSHVMAEIEELADDVVFLIDGQLHFHGSIEALWRLTGEQRLERAVARLMRARVA